MSSTSHHSAPTGRKALRRIRVGATVQALVAKGPVSRTDLAHLTGYSPSTVTGIVQELSRAGYIRDAGQKESTGGRRRALVELDRDALSLVVIQHQDGRVAADLVNLNAGLTHRVERDFSPLTPVESMAAAVKDLLAESGATPLRVVCAVSGVVSKDGAISLSPSLAGASSVRISDALAERIGLPVIVENDVNLIALGERDAGAAKGIDDLVLIHVGEGIGATIISDGGLLHGASRSAGEIGFLPEGLQAGPHGDRGSFEEQWSAPGILRAARATGLLLGGTTVIPDLCATRGPLLEAALQAWAYAAVVCACVVNPEKILFSGAATDLDTAARARLHEIVVSACPSPTEVGFASLGAGSLLRGAVARALEDPSALLADTLA